MAPEGPLCKLEVAGGPKRTPEPPLSPQVRQQRDRSLVENRHIRSGDSLLERRACASSLPGSRGVGAARRFPQYFKMPMGTDFGRTHWHCGGRGIRTHGRFTYGGFQDRSRAICQSRITILGMVILSPTASPDTGRATYVPDRKGPSWSITAQAACSRSAPSVPTSADAKRPPERSIRRSARLRWPRESDRSCA